MSCRIAIGSIPANEVCARLDRTADFARLNRLEPEACRAALIARFGSPPEGCRFVLYDNHHDYRTLMLRIEPAMTDEEGVVACSEQVENGLGS